VAGFTRADLLADSGEVVKSDHGGASRVPGRIGARSVAMRAAAAEAVAAVVRVVLFSTVAA
jgi:hypothetical protein